MFLSTKPTRVSWGWSYANGRPCSFLATIATRIVSAMRFEEFLWCITYFVELVWYQFPLCTLLRQLITERMYHDDTVHAHHKSVACSKSAVVSEDSWLGRSFWKLIDVKNFWYCWGLFCRWNIYVQIFSTAIRKICLMFIFIPGNISLLVQNYFIKLAEQLFCFAFVSLNLELKGHSSPEF